jgi:hypothetical protein
LSSPAVWTAIAIRTTSIAIEDARGRGGGQG